MALKQFSKKTGKVVVVGTKLVASLILNYYFIAGVGLYTAGSQLVKKYTSQVNPPTAQALKEKSVLVVNLRRQFSERSTYGAPQSRWQQIFRSSTGSTFGFHEQMEALRQVNNDDKIAAVYVEVDNFANAAQAWTIAEVLEELRLSGKKVVVNLPHGAFSLPSMLIASAGSERYTNELSTTNVRFPQYGTSYLRGLFDKFDFDFTGARQALYKDLIMAQSKYQVDEDVKSTFDELVDGAQTQLDKIAENLETTPEKLYLEDEAYGKLLAKHQGNSAQVYKELGFYSDIKTSEQITQELAKLAPSRRNKLVPNLVSLNSYTLQYADKLFSSKADPKKKHMAFLALSGGFEGVPNGRNITLNEHNLLRQVYYNANNVEAVVLRVDSPGGLVYVGEALKQDLLDLKTKGIPIVVSQGAVAASAGYMISAPADYIFTTPVTVTGSIGVVSEQYNVGRFYAKYGISGASFGYNPIFGPRVSTFVGISGSLDDNAQAQLKLNKANVGNLYKDFITTVQQNRSKYFKDIFAVNKIAQGHVWLGKSALMLGIADEFGDVDKAVEKARSLALARTETRHTDPFSPGEYKKLEAKDLASQLPVINYSSRFNQSLSGASLARRVLVGLAQVAGFEPALEAVTTSFNQAAVNLDQAKVVASLDPHDFSQAQTLGFSLGSLGEQTAPFNQDAKADSRNADGLVRELTAIAERAAQAQAPQEVKWN